MPKCCLLRKGFDCAKIKTNAPREWNETLGEECYLVALKSVSEKEIYQKCEEELLMAEKNIRKKHPKSKGAFASDTVDLLTDEEEDPAEDEVPTKNDAASVRKRKAAEKAAAAAAKKKAKQLKTLNAKLVKLASNASPTLSAIMEEVVIVVNDAESKGNITMHEKEVASVALSELKEWKHACVALLQAHREDDNAELTLPFKDAKEVSEKIKAVKTMLGPLKASKGKK